MTRHALRAASTLSAARFLSARRTCAAFAGILCMLTLAATAHAVNVPILYYTFDSGSISGSTVSDFGSGGNDGTINGNVSTVSGPLGQAAFVDNSVNNGDNFVDVGTALLSTTDGNQPYSFSFWARTDADGDGGAILSQYPGGANRWLLTNQPGFVPGGNGPFSFWHGDASHRSKGTTDIIDGTFHHVVFVKDAANNVDVYVDGVLDTNLGDGLPHKDTTPFAAENFNVGRGSSTVHPYTGRIDDLGIFDEGLDGIFIKSIFSLAVEPDLQYNLGNAVTLANLQPGEAAKIGDVVWQPTTGLTTPEGEVVFFDGEFLLNFGGGTGVFGIVVPEPSSLALMSVMAIGLLRRSRRKHGPVAPQRK